MGYLSEINIIQNPYYKENQLVDLYHYLIEDGWSISTEWETGAIRYSVEAGDWLELPITESLKFEEILRYQSKNADWTCFLLIHPILDKVIWLYQHENDFSIELQIASNDEQELFWFEKFHDELISPIKKLKQINYIEWRTDYDNKLIRLETDLKHEGVLCFCSSNQLKSFYFNHEFDNNYLEGWYELFKRKIAIVIDSKDYDFTIIVELKKITDVQFGHYNSIDFTDNDELLILSYTDFTMICEKHNGDYNSYGRKNIISIPIENGNEQILGIAKQEDKNDKRLIIQFTDNEKGLKENFWIEYIEIPTHKLGE